MQILEQIKKCVEVGKIDMNSKYPPELAGHPGVMELVKQALDDGIEVETIIQDGLIAGLDVIGAKFSAGECFVPDMVISSQAMKVGMHILEPYLAGKEVKKKGAIILGTVKGDMHDIGKNLVRVLLEGGGFKIIDVGIGATPEKFVEAAKDYPEAVVGMSALLTTTMENMGVTIEALRANRLNNRTIIGGAPVSQKFADEIGADGYGRNATEAVPLVKRLLGITE